MTDTLVSCLCVTEDRQAFMPWLLWNFDKQAGPRRELIVVDSSREPISLPSREDIVLVRCRPGTCVARKRNIALEVATGDIVSWFDDDDWQHPAKLATLTDALTTALVAGSSASWFVDVETGRAASYAMPGQPLFNSVGVAREIAKHVQFDERIYRGSDGQWLRGVMHAADGASVLCAPVFFWLCHEANLSNPARDKVFRLPLAAVRAVIGLKSWGDTDSQLTRVRRDLVERSMRRRTTYRPRICVVVTTCDRAASLDRLLDDLEKQAPDVDLDVRVYDDASTRSYAGIQDRIHRHGWHFATAVTRHGRNNWWHLWNGILADLRRTVADLYVLTQDDMRLCRHFLKRATALWHGIDDPARASLFLHVDEHQASTGTSRWTPVVEEPHGDVARCGWLDLTAVMCDRRTFEALDWNLWPIARQAEDHLLGSGVGAQMSRRLHDQRFSMYRSATSLTVHDATASRLNPAARRRWPMRTVRFIDGDEQAALLEGRRPRVSASLATIPSRVRSLAVVVEALLPQVDRLGIYLNGHETVPAFLRDPKIRVEHSHVTGDLGDVGKFFWADRLDGYSFLCDDDLKYPADYVSRVVAAIDQYNATAVVGVHGVLLDDRVISAYPRSRRLCHFAEVLREDRQVHILGTGTTAYRAGTLQVQLSDFPVPNMSDVFFALLGQAQGVPFMAVRRPHAWLRALPEVIAESIYERAINGDASVNPRDAIRSHAPWRLPQGRHL